MGARIEALGRGMPRVMEIDHVGVVVRDLEEAKRFASDTLGLELEREGPQPALGVHTAFFRAGPVLLELIEFDDAATGAEKIGSDAASRIDHVAFRVGDLQAAHDRLAAAGASFDQEQALELGPNLNFFSRAASTHGIRLQLMQPAGD
jgi:methylmalonyl-CoA/ethylmalonyl-CoA epimerase